MEEESVISTLHNLETSTQQQNVTVSITKQKNALTRREVFKIKWPIPAGLYRHSETKEKNINKGVSLMTKVILCQLIIQNEVKETDLHCTREKGGW